MPVIDGSRRGRATPRMPAVRPRRATARGARRSRRTTRSRRRRRSSAASASSTRGRRDMRTSVDIGDRRLAGSRGGADAGSTCAAADAPRRRRARRAWRRGARRAAGRRRRSHPRRPRRVPSARRVRAARRAPGRPRAPSAAAARGGPRARAGGRRAAARSPPVGGRASPRGRAARRAGRARGRATLIPIPSTAQLLLRVALGEDAGDLATVEQDVVGPLDRRSRSDDAGDGDGAGERQQHPGQSRSTRDISSARPGGALHVRPWRPRPARCSPAVTSVPCGAPAAASARAMSLVESVTRWWRRGRPSDALMPARSGSRRRAAGRARPSAEPRLTASDGAP